MYGSRPRSCPSTSPNVGPSSSMTSSASDCVLKHEYIVSLAPPPSDLPDEKYMGDPCWTGGVHGGNAGIGGAGSSRAVLNDATDETELTDLVDRALVGVA